MVVVRGEGHDTGAALVTEPVVVVRVDDDPAARHRWADLVVHSKEVDAVVARLERAPRAAVSLALLLRALPGVGVESGLAMESAVYSMLQAGPEFAHWRSTQPAAPVADDAPCVMIDRIGSQLVLTLDRPRRHNAISTRMRNELCDALVLPLIDDSISSVVLRGNGPSFCSGGDLDEFGSRADPATAHMVRLARSPGRLIHRQREIVRVQIHGAAIGGGIEMAAFAGRVEIDPDAIISLPELELGLIPGAGGTVSVSRRIGRERTAQLALGGRVLDGRSAVEWGLADRLLEPGSLLSTVAD